MFRRLFFILLLVLLLQSVLSKKNEETAEERAAKEKKNECRLLICPQYHVCRATIGFFWDTACIKKDCDCE